MDASPPSTATDQELLAAVAAGDHQALRLLYDRHAPWLSIRLSRRSADQDLTDTALQDTFLAVWRRAAQYTGRGEVAAWIWGIAIRRLIDGVRRRPAGTESLTDADAFPSAEEQVLLGVEHGDLGSALQRLSPELRAVVQATVLDGLTSREAGHLLGIPSGTVKTRMMRARRQLREALA